ncbi:MAG: hypothetical protein P4L72_10280 [Parvibaculum sp.]|jgi:hypothetical protein|uniref:hypothetical protein n=1 Tax=Parvibaculum sp. TaxID=2024848 RepID=UPI00284E93FE|nr:hypothetical protein [Parvibaculum sp.]MDR3499601.1 hypothetical protein [Parvibaculum sp.]
MALTVNYPSPVTVNGFKCRNCTEVDEAKKHIDPAHPKSGPYGVDADSDPSISATDPRKIRASEAKDQVSPGAAASPYPDPNKGRLVNMIV